MRTYRATVRFTNRTTRVFTAAASNRVAFLAGIIADMQSKGQQGGYTGREDVAGIDIEAESKPFPKGAPKPQGEGQRAPA